MGIILEMARGALICTWTYGNKWVNAISLYRHKKRKDNFVEVPVENIPRNQAVENERSRLHLWKQHGIYLAATIMADRRYFFRRWAPGPSGPGWKGQRPVTLERRDEKTKKTIANARFGTLISFSSPQHSLEYLLFYLFIEQSWNIFLQRFPYRIYSANKFVENQNHVMRGVLEIRYGCNSFVHHVSCVLVIGLGEISRK